MALNPNTTTVDEAFFQPLTGLVESSLHARNCPEFTDANWLRFGLTRVLESAKSGRGFLQEHGPRFEDAPRLRNYFTALTSERRRDLVTGVNLALINESKWVDRLADIPELALYECFALDGHWHKAATHDPRHEGVKMAVGHFYSLNLRGHQLRQLAVGEGLHEHDMSVLKRIHAKGLRHGVPKGRRVLIVYDKAGIDFDFWKACCRRSAIYFLSRVKEGMVYDWIESRLFNRQDSRNRGVTEDRVIMTTEGHKMRIVFYTDPETGKKYEFLTNEMDLPAGVIAELYRRRWEAEKVFDEIKNKLEEKKAWATSLVAKTIQAQMVAITHNLMVLYEQRLEENLGITNKAEDERREKRTHELVKVAAQAGRQVSSLLLRARRTTQRSVKFVRWLRHALRESLAEAAAAPRLAELYATL